MLKGLLWAENTREGKTYKKSTNNKCWRGCGEREASCTVGGNIN